MDLKELKQLRSKMGELRDSENEGSFLAGVDACLKLLDEEIDTLAVKEEIEKLEARLSDLRSKLPSGDLRSKPTNQRKTTSLPDTEEEKPQAAKRGRPRKVKVEEAETE